MAPTDATAAAQQPGPHPSFIQIAKSFSFEQQIQSLLIASGANPAREELIRQQGVTWIDDVRKALQLPDQTYNTACIYFHRFRLVHRDTEYEWSSAAAASLLAACKIEDTLKKSRDILCASANLRLSPQEQLSSDDSVFEISSRAVIGLERLMLESSSFDFRNRYPQKYIVKLARECRMDKSVAVAGYNVLQDLYRTFAPLKATTSTMSFACLELAVRIMGAPLELIRGGERVPTYEKWRTSRDQVMEVMLDLLELYTNSPKPTIMGQTTTIEKLVDIRIALNKEADEKGIKRYAHWYEPKANGHKVNKTPKTPITPASPSDARLNGKADLASPATLSPRSSGSGRRGVGARGQDGTVRFMLDARQAKQETRKVDEYFKDEYEEIETEVEEPAKESSDRYRSDRDYRRDRGGRYSGSYGGHSSYDRDFKRIRR